VDFVESKGDHVERRHVIRHLDTLGMEHICTALEQKYGSRPQLDDVSSAAPRAPDRVDDIVAFVVGRGGTPDRAQIAADVAQHGIESVCLSLEHKYQCSWPGWRAWGEVEACNKSSYASSQARDELLASITTPERALSPLEAELQNLKLGALSRRVSEAGAPTAELEALQDEDDPKAALIRWLVARSSNGDAVAPAATVSEGVPPVRDLQDDFSHLTLQPSSSNDPSAPPPGAGGPGAASTGHGGGGGGGVSPVADLAALSETLADASPPTHGFGRARTTGFGEQDDSAFDALLAQLGLGARAAVLRDRAIVNETELRDMTEAEASELLSVEERNRWLLWRG
jgi:hypothetical protein